MTNKEKYGNEIIELAVNGQVLGLKNGQHGVCMGKWRNIMERGWQ